MDVTIWSEIWKFVAEYANIAFKIGACNQKEPARTIMTLAQTPRWTEMNISSIILYNWTTSPAKRENNLRRYRKLDRLKWIQHKISYENSCVRRCSLKMEAWNPKNKSWKSWKHFQLTFYFLASWKSHNIGGCTIPSKRCSFLHCQSQTATV